MEEASSSGADVGVCTGKAVIDSILFSCSNCPTARGVDGTLLAGAIVGCAIEL
jgi:hypothetical protein